MKASQVSFLMLALLSFSACTATVNVQEDVDPTSNHVEDSTTSEQVQENTATVPTAQDEPSSIDSSPDFLTTFKTYRDHPHMFGKDIMDREVISQVKVNNCPPNPDGICGYTLEVSTYADWSVEPVQEYLICTTGGGPMECFGPFMGNLPEIKAELDNVSELTEL